MRRGLLGAAVERVLGRPIELAPAMLARYPELADARYRRGGLPPRVGGWALGEPTVEAITLWRTVFLGRDASASADLLLHEVRHVHQFQASRAFPLAYLWESIRRGYHRNRFEIDARAYAAARLRTRPPPRG
ncbi:MAG: hypothetical protein WKG32_00290 [Gemmatimonadaceae bacterium]